MNNQLNNDQDGKRPDNKDPRQGSGKNHQSILAFLICLLVTLVCFALFTNMLKDNSSEISYDKFIDMVDKDQVKEVTIQSSTLTIVPKKKNSKYEDMSYYTTKTEDSTALTKRLEGKGIKFETDPPDVFGEFVAMILSVVLPTLLLFRTSDVLHAPHEQRRRDHGHGRRQEQCQGICAEGNGRYL